MQKNKTHSSDFFDHFKKCLEKTRGKINGSSGLLGRHSKSNFLVKRRGPGHLMTGEKIQILLNNFCNYEEKDIFYLEIGCYTGQSVCSAMYENSGKFVCNDNFSKYGNVKKQLLANIEKFKKGQDVKFIEKNCWDLDKEDINTPIDIYFFDGPHDQESQKNALLKFVDYFAEEFIFIVDDFNYDPVKLGTFEGIESIKGTYELVHEKTFVTKGYENYHNGLYTAFFKRSKE